ncbi:isochorismate synthase [Candidatus Kapabacteria bacterium]|nr:isochorismate synthase [Candidatus Kapabacteria bacterium]
MSWKNKFKQEVLSCLKQEKEYDSKRYYSIDIQDKSMDIKEIFLSYKSSFKIYFQNNETKKFVSHFHAIVSFTKNELENLKVHQLVNELLESKLNLYYCSRYYKEQTIDSDWKNIPENQFVIPRLEFLETKMDKVLRFTFKGSEVAKLGEIIDSIIFQFDKQNTNNSNPIILSQKYFPDKINWKQMVTSVKNLINQGSYDKIVLARKLEISYSDEINSEIIFEKLTLANPKAYNFFYRIENKDFFGASPELLFNRDGRSVKSDALAGTRKISINEDENNIIADELLNNQKDKLEQKIVRDEIERRLNKVCNNLSVSKTRIKRLKYLLHIHNEIEGDLNDSVSDLELINLLHPTPAVGTLPNLNTDIIFDLEKWDRGMYAAPIGFISKDKSEIVVGIRTAFKIDKKLFIFTGAGIVSESDAESEWTEINNKMQNFIKIIKK